MDEQYFSKLDPAILHTLRSDAEKKRKRPPGAHAIDLVEQATHGIRIEYSESIHKVILAPQYHSAPYTIKDYFQGLMNSALLSHLKGE